MVRQSVLDCLLWLGWTQLVDLNCQRIGWIVVIFNTHRFNLRLSLAEASLGELSGDVGIDGAGDDVAHFFMPMRVFIRIFGQRSHGRRIRLFWCWDSC